MVGWIMRNISLYPLKHINMYATNEEIWNTNKRIHTLMVMHKDYFKTQ